MDHEPIDLGLRQGIGPVVFQRILGGQDQEGLPKGEGLISEGNLSFLHGFQEGRLDLRRGPVDFVRQNDVGEDGSRGRDEGFGLFLEDHASEDIGRQKVGSELDSPEGSVDGIGQASGQKGFRQARDPLEKDVAPGE